MSELTTEQIEQREAKIYNGIIANGLSLKNKLDIVFDEYQEFIKNRLGEEGYGAIVKIINPVTRDDIERIASFYYNLKSCWNYKDYTKVELERAFEIIFDDEEKVEIKRELQEFLFLEYADEYLAEKVAYVYYRFFSFRKLELWVNSVILELDVSLEPKIKEIIKRYEENSR